MKANRTKRLTLERALKILQLEFGTQVKQIIKDKNTYIANSICGEKRKFSRIDILKLEDKMYSAFGY